MLQLDVIMGFTAQTEIVEKGSMKKVNEDRNRCIIIKKLYEFLTSFTLTSASRFSEALLQLMNIFQHVHCR